ncbi:MAG: molybdopterin-dependent oxidoreductase [Coriobacteriia bacterium]
MEFKNDLGKPWQFEEDGYTVTRSCAWSAPGCHPVGCGIKYYVKDGKLVKVEGDENHPVTKGRLCVRCLTLKDFVYHPDRVIYPMKRAKEDRGKDKWVRITRDEAYDIIAENLDHIKAEYGAESIVALCGTGRQNGVPGVGAHRALGTPNGCYTQSGFACYGPRVSITTYVLGSPYPEIDYAGGLPGGYDDPQYKVPELIVQWGKEPLASNGDGLFGHAVVDLMKRGAKLMTIDPRVTWTGAQAAYHLQIRPGTDAALGMAMLNVIISEDLYDHDFVDKWCYGFEQLAERVATMPPEKAAEICWIKPEEIYEAARAYAAAKPAAIAWGLAIDQTVNGAQAGHCILALMAICGNVDVPGGQLLLDVFDGEGDVYVAGLGWKMLDEELQQKIIGLEEYPAYVGIMLMSHADRTLDAMETGKPYGIHAAWIGTTNLLSPTASAQPKRWHNALNRLDFVFATDVWMTPTAMACADVFLPVASICEQEAIVSTHYGASANYMGALNKVIEVGDCVGEFHGYRQLGLRCNPKAWEGYHDSDVDFVEEFYTAGTGVTYKQLQEEVVHQRKVSYRKYETGHLRPDGQAGFNTQTGRFELYSYAFQGFGEDPLPYYVEPPYSPIATPEVYKDYPLILTTGARTYSYFHSEGRQIPYLRELVPDPIVEINLEDATAQGIHDGDWVRIENWLGFCFMKAKITPTIKVGMVHAQHGWWFPEEDGEYPHLFGVWKSNINQLVPHSRNGKLGFGAPYKAMLCRISKAEEADLASTDQVGLTTPGQEPMTYDDNFYRLDKARAEAR